MPLGLSADGNRLLGASFVLDFTSWPRLRQNGRCFALDSIYDESAFIALFRDHIHSRRHEPSFAHLLELPASTTML